MPCCTQKPWKILFGVLMVLMILAAPGPSVCAQNAIPNPADAAAAPPRKIKDPVMKSIFWNTLLGSAWGALMGVAGALTGPNLNFGSIRESLVVGTTIGGLIGYGLGTFVVLRGISFDASKIPLGASGNIAQEIPIPLYQVASDDHSSRFQFAFFQKAGSPKDRQPVAIFQMKF